MSDKNLLKLQKTKAKPNECAVEIIEQVASDIKSGKLIGIAFVAIGPNGEINMGASEVMHEHVLRTVGQMELLKGYLLEANINL